MFCLLRVADALAPVIKIQRITTLRNAAISPRIQLSDVLSPRKGSTALFSIPNEAMTAPTMPLRYRYVPQIKGNRVIKVMSG